jgi:hypothetical protein
MMNTTGTPAAFIQICLEKGAVPFEFRDRPVLSHPIHFPSAKRSIFILTIFSK